MSKTSSASSSYSRSLKFRSASKSILCPPSGNGLGMGYAPCHGIFPPPPPPNLPVSLKGPRKKEVDILLKLEFPYKAPDFGASNNNCAPAIRVVKWVLVPVRDPSIHYLQAEDLFHSSHCKRGFLLSSLQLTADKTTLLQIKPCADSAWQCCWKKKKKKRKKSYPKWLSQVS